MLIECLIQRDGLTEVNHAGMKYIFKERPELTDGDKEAKVCEVCADHAIKRLLAYKTMYREYIRKVAKPTVAAAAQRKPAEAPVPKVTLTKDAFFVLTNVMQINAVINKCEDKEVLNAIGAEEHSSKTRRQWVINTLEGRLRELADKELPGNLMEVLA